ncbi:MAG: hypothetical protein ACTSRG_22810 [Candidatus Helarchaeota archaeon]
MMRVQEIFILKDGLPLYHYKNKDSKLKKSLDNSLLTGFLSAIINFTKETGLGNPTTYITSSIKFSFFEQSDLFYVVCTDPSFPDSKLIRLYNRLSLSILKVIDDLTEKIDNFQFKIIVNKVLYDLQKDDTNLLKTINENNRNEVYFREIIPKRHIDDKEILINKRRKLFKLINGKNSIYDLAVQMNSSPSKILNILRSYQKEGIISF